MPGIEKVVKQFIRNNNKVLPILNGESPDTFLAEFPDLVKYHLTIYYDRYNSFRFENSVENPGSIILVIQNKRKIKIFTLNQYLIIHKV